MLSRVKISHFKSLAEVDIALSKNNIIVGPNGSGKSNFIDCLAFIKDATEENLDSAITKRHGTESIRQWSKTKPYNITIELYFASPHGDGSYRLIISSHKEIYKVNEEYGAWKGLGIKIDRSRTIENASFSRDKTGKLSFRTTVGDLSDLVKTSSLRDGELFISQAAASLSTLHSFIFRHLADEITAMSPYSIYPNTIRLPQAVSKSKQLDKDGSNLAAVIKRLNVGRKRSKERFLDSLRIVMPSVSDIEIHSAGGFYVPLIRVREENGEQHKLNMSQVSDGTLRMLGLLTAFYQPEAPTRIAIEEPEQMVHPGLLPVLKDAASDYLDMVPDSQCLITSHSPTFLDLFVPEDIIWVNFRDGKSDFGKISDRQMKLIREQLFSAGEILLAEGFAS